jgi:hypothetical protein
LSCNFALIGEDFSGSGKTSPAELSVSNASQLIESGPGVIELTLIHGVDRENYAMGIFTISEGIESK